jgi:hypothetical protein
MKKPTTHLKTLTTHWDLLRIIRLLMGLAVLASAFVDRQPWLGAAGLLLLFQAATNTGCGASGCGLPARPAQQTDHLSKEEEKITYEEVR